LNNLDFPAKFYTFFKGLIRVVTADIKGLLRDAGLELEMIKVTETDAFDENWAELGFRTTQPITNLSTLNFFYFLVIISIVAVIVKQRGCLQKLEE